MKGFATYLNPHTCYTSKPMAEIEFAGYSMPYFAQVRQALAQELAYYPSLPVRQTALAEYGRIHTSTYLTQLQDLADGKPVDPLPKLSLECRGYEFCLPAYTYGLGGFFEAIDQMKAGKLERAYLFAPGGHHAYADWGHGYCLLNPMAAAVRYAQEQGFEKVVIVDWDLHHGDGTQAIFAHDPSVYHMSIHSAADLYMATKVGLRYGSSTTAESLGHCNIPLLHTIYPDEFWRRVDENGRFYRAVDAILALQTALQNLPFQPDILFLFSGYDAHIDDRGRDITNWTNQDYQKLTQLALTLAEKANCPILSAHGGGYNLPVTISAAIDHITTLTGQ